MSKNKSYEQFLVMNFARGSIKKIFSLSHSYTNLDYMILFFDKKNRGSYMAALRVAPILSSRY
jgi:hypothetical protein